MIWILLLQIYLAVGESNCTACRCTNETTKCRICATSSIDSFKITKNTLILFIILYNNLKKREKTYFQLAYKQYMLLHNPTLHYFVEEPYSKDLHTPFYKSFKKLNLYSITKSNKTIRKLFTANEFEAHW